MVGNIYIYILYIHTDNIYSSSFIISSFFFRLKAFIYAKVEKNKKTHKNMQYHESILLKMAATQH